MEARTGLSALPGPGLSIDFTHRIRAYVALTKPRIIELLLITTVPTMFLAAGRFPSIRLMLLTVGGGTLAAGGANALNMIYDRDIDAQMERTRNRPLVTGAVRARPALIFALLLEVVAFVVLWRTVNLLSAGLTISATVFYVGVYTMWLKRTSSQNIVIGGAAGAIPVLVGWTAVTDHLAAAPFVLFGIVFLWTPPHFWALAIRYRDDYRNAEVPMLPAIASMDSVVRQIVIYTILLSGLSFALVPIAHLGVEIYAVIVLLSGIFLQRSIVLLKDPSPKRAMQLFGYSITYLTALFVAVGADAVVRHV